MMIRCNKCIKDVSPNIVRKANNNVASCPLCGGFIKNLPHDRSNQTDFELGFGKFKGEKISNMNNPERINYLRWLISLEDSILKDWQKEIIKKKLG